MRSLSSRALGSLILVTAATIPALADPSSTSPTLDTGPAAPAAAAKPAAPVTPVAASKPAAAAQTEAAAKAPEKKKSLNTVPEDGTGMDELWAPSKWVRDILERRPNEDLIICIAGCFSNRDKIVYAQNAEKKPELAPAVAETPAAAQPAEVQPTSINPAPEAKSGAVPAKPDAKTEAKPDAPTTQVINAKPEGEPKPAPAAAPAPAATPAPAPAVEEKSSTEMVPTAASPNADNPTVDTKPETAGEAADKAADDQPKSEGESAAATSADAPSNSDAPKIENSDSPPAESQIDAPPQDGNAQRDEPPSESSE